jgi:O-acetyl-ADP-ribose deacetylase (regulator of RNase III)
MGDGRIELVRGNIVDQEVDAIVNAANRLLAGGGGVDGAIHRAAGPELIEACRALPKGPDGNRCPTGEVRVTDAFALRARYIIHGVGPIYDDHAPPRAHALLRSVHVAALTAAAERDCRSIAFPAISTGVYGFPIDAAAEIAIGAAKDFLAVNAGPIELVRFVLFSDRDLATFERHA